MNFSSDEIGFTDSPQKRGKSATAVGGNLLVESAASLFSIVNRLNGMGLSFRNDEFLEGLTEEMRAFENKISARYNTNYMIMVRSVVCAFIDEMIAKSEWGVRNKWSADTLSQVFVVDNSSGTRTFFVILEQASQEPVMHLDLLEFMYLCMHFGFEGKYKAQKRNNGSLADTINNLYRLIYKYRNQMSEDLLVLPVQNEVIKLPQSRKNNYFWWGLAVGLAIAALTTGTVYWSLDAKLQNAAGVVYKNFEGSL